MPIERELEHQIGGVESGRILLSGLVRIPAPIETAPNPLLLWGVREMAQWENHY